MKLSGRLFTFIITAALICCCSSFQALQEKTPTAPASSLQSTQSSPQPTTPRASTLTPAPTPKNSSLYNVPFGERSIYAPGLISTEQTVLSDLDEASEYRIDLTIAENYETVTGHQIVRYTNQEQIPLPDIYFRLFPNINGGKATLSNVQVNAENIEPVYEYQNSAAKLTLPTPLQPGENIRIEMDFEIEIPRTMGGNYGLFGYFNDTLVLDTFYPTIPAYDDRGWYKESPARVGDISYYDSSFYLVRINAPQDVIIVASGVELEREFDNQRQIITYAAGPARDYYLTLSKKFNVISATVGETTINSYAAAEYRQGQELALETAVHAIQSYNQRLGTYPYTEFDIASAPMQALGVEYPGMTTIADYIYDPTETAWGNPAPEMLEIAVAHEVGHAWFYNAVGNDQVGEPWLDEAVVQYITGLYYLDRYGQNAFLSVQSSWEYRWDSIGREDIPIGLSVNEYTAAEYSPIVYGRGPLFIAALANEMGQSNFDAFLKDYYQTHKWEIVHAEDFLNLAETHCQCQLDKLYEIWVY